MYIMVIRLFTILKWSTKFCLIIFFSKEKLLIYSPKFFIFSNEVFSDERNNLINQVIKKFDINNDGDKIISEKLLELIDEINEIDEDNKIQRIYHNLQNILIYIYYSYIKNNPEKINKKITLKEICEKLEEKWI